MFWKGRRQFVFLEIHMRGQKPMIISSWLLFIISIGGRVDALDDDDDDMTAECTSLADSCWTPIVPLLSHQAPLRDPPDWAAIGTPAVQLANPRLGRRSANLGVRRSLSLVGAFTQARLEGKNKKAASGSRNTV